MIVSSLLTFQIENRNVATKVSIRTYKNLKMCQKLSNVYDLIYPSPVTLKEIASTAVAMKLLRQRVKEYLSSNTMSDLYLEHFDIFDSRLPKNSLRNVFPHLPSTVLRMVEKCYGKLQYSLGSWTGDRAIVDVWLEMDYIACTFNGNIHHDKIAKRVVLCEEVSNEIKFKTACRFCFEDDIVRIWPSVSEHFNLSDIDFNEQPLLYYWICRMKNELHKIPLSGHDYADFDERLLQILGCRIKNWPSVEYFWNRLKLKESRIENAVHLLVFNAHVFCRYILARLSKEEFDALMALKGNEIMFLLLRDTYNIDDEPGARRSTERLCILAAWKFIRHNISDVDFIRFAKQIFRFQTENSRQILNGQSFSYEFWNNTPDHLKQLVIRDCLVDRSLFVKQPADPSDRYVWLLLCVLKEIPFEARSTFWRENWDILFRGIRKEDLQELLTLCCKDNDEIILFKENHLSGYENVRSHGLMYMEDTRLQELDEFLNFCCREKETISAFKVKLLNEYMNSLHDRYLVDREIFSFHDFIIKAHSLSLFINEVFNDVHLAADFKHKILLAPRTTRTLCNWVVSNFKLEDLMQFVDMFVIPEQAVDFKEHHFLPALVNYLSNGSDFSFAFENAGFQRFMEWCLGSEEKIAEFKGALPLYEIIHHVTENEEEINLYSYELKDERSWGRKRLKCLYPDLIKFLEWCLSSPEEVEEFKKRVVWFETYAPYL
ncbi:uncharacterized protein LOC135845359 [Planococcus citri]|uniref:uncharacterized protein LOC135845359 n=1 Tax=Planococcus citri TaxID=170843 RepID=UPI0031FA0583